MVISDTSPICNLALIGKLHLLREEFTTIHIPPAVWKELMDWEQQTAKQQVSRAIEEKWIRIVEIKNREFFDQLIAREELDSGEVEAIVLAQETANSLLLMDEAEGRGVARAMRLNCTGLLGIVTAAHKRGRIDSLQAIIAKLRAEAHFFISPALEKELLKNVGE